MALSKPDWASVWTPLLAAAVRGNTEYQYRLGVKHFLEWVDSEGAGRRGVHRPQRGHLRRRGRP